MHADGLNALVVGVPLLLVLVASVLRVDEHFFSSSSRAKSGLRRPRFSVAEDAGEMVLTDPDGRPFQVAKGRAK